MIGHTRTDGRLTRYFLKGTLSDALHADLCGCGHKTRMILAHLRARSPLLKPVSNHTQRDD
jgi:IS5 family transposase